MSGMSLACTQSHLDVSRMLFQVSTSIFFLKSNNSCSIKNAAFNQVDFLNLLKNFSVSFRTVSCKAFFDSSIILPDSEFNFSCNKAYISLKKE